MTQNRALLIVDVQVDFTTGSLAVANGTEVAKKISAELTGDDRYALIVASRDWHDAAPSDNGGHFALDAEPDFVNTWPVHCVADSAGAAFDPELFLPARTVEVRKGMGRPDYSAFQGDTKGIRLPLGTLLGARDIDVLDVVGIATDHCVQASALDALVLTRPVDVRVLTDYCAGVDDQASAKALEALADLGAQVLAQ